MVVNADADQVIIAQGGTQRPGRLPTIHHYSGGLENPKSESTFVKYSKVTIF